MPAPSTFSAEYAEKILALYKNGKTTAEAAREIGVDPSTISDWRMAHIDFDRACIRARAVGFETQADSLLTIPDEYNDVQKARLKSDNLKWVLARRAPEQYGDRLSVDVTTVDLTAALTDARTRAQLPGRYPADSIEAEYSEISNALPDSATGFKSVEAESTNADEIESVDIFS